MTEDTRPAAQREHRPACDPFAHTSVTDLLAVERLERDLFRSTTTTDVQSRLYGGQVAAQALHVAGQTVEPSRTPHSLHGYYVRAGDPAVPVVFRVERDRDGRSFSSRRVVALQRGETVFTLSTSFHLPGESVSFDHDELSIPEVPAPETLPAIELKHIASVEGRQPPQPHPGALWLTRLWLRCTTTLPADPLLRACVLTYVSDLSNGLFPLYRGQAWVGPSLDHAVWFHRPAKPNDWLLMDLSPHSVAAGRGFYSGTLSDRDGRLIATMTQEGVFRARDRATVHAV